ncbi:Hypothetical protein ORPV_447 [Orpheovirus IHUMI-LCC2]|uniref:F-box domain-containing protein n=1 Tax=Orpheovirus IHUMI-LCC2 TaxID=2023057 RepID=A0A2I2L4B3_9VIRU|nr:Hypothetical protein ORPV_447 [Orpheovirus IHUMI-LCC2]SNW62351.1 Hypothetical protein ORPV_447 [Orpheovirus IHUMI-LCC2]
MEIVCEDILLLIFKDLDVLTLYNLRMTNKWIKFIIDCNPKLFWYKHYDMAKIKLYVNYHDNINKRHAYLMLCTEKSIIILYNPECRYMINYVDDCVFSSYPLYNKDKTIVYF